MSIECGVRFGAEGEQKVMQATLESNQPVYNVAIMVVHTGIVASYPSAN